MPQPAAFTYFGHHVWRGFCQRGDVHQLAAHAAGPQDFMAVPPPAQG
jgi:hypothetical protein